MNVIVAIDDLGGIGKGGDLAWRLSGDLKHFKQLTLGTEGQRNAVIMGRKTWDSLPEKFRPLPGRLNIVISRNAEFVLPQGVFACTSLHEAEELCAKQGIDQAFVIGGGQIYEQALQCPSLESLYITKVSGNFGCDVFFPKFEHLAECQERSEPFQENGLSYHFERWLFQRAD